MDFLKNKYVPLKEKEKSLTHREFYRMVVNNQLLFIDKINSLFDENQKISKDFLKRILSGKNTLVARENIVKSVNGVIKTDSGNIYDPSNLTKNHEMFEFEYTNKHTDGFWDIKISDDVLPKTCLVEYKTSVNEMSIDDILIQIKKRRNIPGQKNNLTSLFDKEFEGFSNLIDETWYEEKSYKTVLVTFDSRFEKYRRLLWNENIELLILDFEEFEHFEYTGYIHHNACKGGGS